MPPTLRRWWDSAWVVPVAITLLALILRLIGLDRAGLWYDEVYSVDFAQSGLRAVLTDRFGVVHNQQVLHYLMVWLMAQIADPTTTTVWVRLPSVLAATATVPLVMLLGRAWFGPGVGRLAGLLLALAPVHLKYAQDARPYAWLALGGLAVVYCFWQAVQTDRLRWWAAFAGSAVATMLLHYVTLTLLLPALALPIAVLLVVRGRAGGWGALARPLGALAVIALVASGVMLDAVAVAANPPRLDTINWLAFAQGAFRTLIRQSQLNLLPDIDFAVQQGLVGVALLGLILAWVARRRAATGLAACLVGLPPILLGVFQTSNVVFGRYVLFMLPVYLLLMAQGIVGLAAYGRPGRAAAGLLGLIVGGLFLWGTVGYNTPAIHRNYADYPDYRGLAAYLAATAKPADRIILVDDTAQSALVTRFYWHNRPPAPAFDARDPRLFAGPPAGTVYWVLSFANLDEPDRLARLGQADPTWRTVARFDRLIVLAQPAPADIPGALGRLISLLPKEPPAVQGTRTLQGARDQAAGNTAAAAQDYRAAGSIYPLAPLFLQTANGYATRGQEDRAWIEASTAKSLDPSNPLIHRWMAAHLLDDDPALSSLETAIADALAAGP
jgi:4-amino-4-deoxy-L-arabinose transferase-like glycosyltransferase